MSATRGRSAGSQADSAITDIRFYAWYWDGNTDTARYHELGGFPVGDDTDEYPDFDIVVTIKNNGPEHMTDARLKVTIAYRVGPINEEKPGETPESSYEIAKKQARWRRPEWAKDVRVPSLAPGRSRQIRVACIPIEQVTGRYGREGKWPYRARVHASLTTGRDRQIKTNPRMQKEIPIDMLD